MIKFKYQTQQKQKALIQLAKSTVELSCILLMTYIHTSPTSKKFKFQNQNSNNYRLRCNKKINSCIYIYIYTVYIRDKWLPVTTAWRVLRLRMEEQPPIWRVAANILNKQSRTADKEWSSSLGVGRGANNPSP